MFTQKGGEIKSDLEYNFLGQKVAVVSTYGDIVVTLSANTEKNTLLISIWVWRDEWILFNTIVEEQTISPYASLAMSKDSSIIVLGVPYDGESGHVNIYVLDAERYTNDNVLRGNNKNENFGYSVSINSDGTKIIVGSNNYDEGLGMVKTYSFRENTVEQLGEEIIGENKSDLFGSNVFINETGDYLAVSNTSYNDEVATKPGLVKIYTWNDTFWKQIGGNIVGKNEDDNLGTSMAINADGSIVVLSAPYSSNGYVRTFSLTSDEWTEYTEALTGESEGEGFGLSLSISSKGNLLVVGSPKYKGFTGIVRMYELTSKTWTKYGADLEGSNSGEIGDSYGSNVMITGDGKYFVIGAPTGNSYKGFSEVYSVTDPKCLLSGSLILTDESTYTEIDNIQPGDWIYNKNYERVQVIGVIKQLSEMSPFVIKKDALGENLPFNDLYLTNNHHVYHNNKMKTPQQMKNNKTVYKTEQNKNTYVYYNIMTNDTDNSMIVNGLGTETLYKNKTNIKLLTRKVSLSN